MAKEEEKQSTQHRMKSIAPHLVLFCVNLWLFLRIALQTMIPTLGLVELYILLGLLFSIVTREEQLKYKTWIGFSLVPLMINLLLCINYWLSVTPVTETYAFGYKEERMPAVAVITLHNNAYQPYHGFRMFYDKCEMEKSNSITYTFKTGLFRIRVMTGYQFGVTTNAPELK